MRFAVFGRSRPPGPRQLFAVDGQAFYMGSQNLYRADLAELGLIVDDAELTAQLGARFDQMQAAGAGLQAELDVSRAEKAQLEERLAEAQASIADGRRQLIAAQSAYTAQQAQIEAMKNQGAEFVAELRAQTAAARAAAGGGL